MTTTSVRPGRGVVLTNGLVAVALIAIIAAVALAVKPPAPPGIAEFAPQASKPITKAPLSQSSTNGSGAGQCLTASCPSPSPSPSVRAAHAPGVGSVVAAGVPSALQCFQWPDGAVTQTFDPQSPPCIASWPGAAKGNGGATSQGVTATEIKVVEPEQVFTSSITNNLGPEFAQILKFFNSHFELYGRQLVLQGYGYEGSTNDPRVEASAAKGVAQLKPFASTQFSATVDSQWEHYLTRSHVVSVDMAPEASDADFSADAPYAYSYGPTAERSETAAAQFVCSDLVGQKARYAGGALSSQQRKFAILNQGYGAPTPTTALVSGLGACGISSPKVYTFAEPGTNPADNLSTFAPLMSSMHRDGVTSVIYLGDNNDLASLQQSASSLGYEPEWMLPGVLDQYQDNYPTSAYSEDRNTFGVATMSKYVSVPNQMWFQALTAVDPTFEYSNSVQPYFYEQVYRQLLVIAAGVQEAGPALTPAGFEAGLQATDFPNPGSGEPPYFQASVGFQGKYSMSSDFGLWWYSTAETNSEDANSGGGMCWVDRGRRWDLGAIPKGIVLQQGACR